MSIHIQNTQVKDIQAGDKRILQIYKGNRCVFTAVPRELQYTFNSVTGSYTITGIADSARTSIKVLQLPETYIGADGKKYVGEIGVGAFENCTLLQTVRFPKNNRYHSIDGFAFRNCESLKSIYLPYSSMITVIQNSTFENCKSLETIEIPEPIYVVESGAFYNCTSLRFVRFPSSLRSIYYDAFYNCTSLTDIRFSGTKSQWNAITKGSHWNYNVPATVVHCSDGDAPL